MTYRSFAVAAVAIVCLSACGGGGGSGPRMAAPNMDVAPMPEPVTPTPAQGVSVELKTDSLEYSTEYIKSAMQFYAAQGDIQIQDWRPMVPRPVIRPAADTSFVLQFSIINAVNAINAWLPYDQHLRLGPFVNEFTRDPSEIPTGEIHVGQSSVPLPDLHPGTLGVAQADRTADGNNLRAGTVLLTSTLESFPLTQLNNTLIHELLHTLGLWGHLNPTLYPDSIMSPYNTDDVVLPRFDGLTLLMGYTQLRPGASFLEISATDFGPWTENVPAIIGRLESCNCAFGADLVGGHAVSWFGSSDEAPDMSVYELGLTGTASWDGKMVGWTTDQEAAWSDVTIDVDLGSGTTGLGDLEGQVAFDNITLYETGTQWGPGELAYNIDVLFNLFSSDANNPDGYVFGNFVGQNLEGAVGALEHPDLTGAFGGNRQ